MPDAAPPGPLPDRTVIEADIGPYVLAAATSFGPRLVSLRLRYGPELFARLGDGVAIHHPESGTYRFHGGHRLWAAPEVPAISYATDDHRCAVTSGPDWLAIEAPPDSAGLIKHLSAGILARIEGEGLVVDHRLENAGPRPISVAPWGITQFRLGGVALLPTGIAGAQNALQGDRSLVIWPYTNLADPRLSWRRRAAVVATLPGPRFKIGSGPNPGRLGYLIDGQLFTKEIPPAGDGMFSDRGAVAQIFVDDSFCELESLGPIVALEPGSSVSHREVWEISDCADVATAYERVAEDAGR